MKNFKFATRLAAYFLALALVAGTAPALVFAGGAMAVKISYQAGAEGFKIAKGYFTVDPGLSEKYGYIDSQSGQKATALDAIVAAHIYIFGDKKEDINANMAVAGSGFLNNFMGDGAGNFSYYLNGETVYSAAGEAVLTDGDNVELFGYQDTTAYSDVYTWFEAGGHKVGTFSAGINDPIELAVKGIIFDSSWNPVAINVTGAALVPVTVDNGKGSFGGPLAEMGDDGKVSVSFGAAGTYIISAVSGAYPSPLMSPWLTVVVGGAGNADKTGLENAIQKAKAYAEPDYTASSWLGLQDALKIAEWVMLDANANISDIESALSTLNSAIGSLVKKPVDDPSIPKILDTVSAMYKGSGKEWEAIDMSAYGLADYIDKDALKQTAESIAKNDKSTPTDLERIAIALTAVGFDASNFELPDGSKMNFIERIAEFKSSGEYSLGYASGYIYALSAYDSGGYAPTEGSYWTRGRVISKLLESQTSGGGWNWAGDNKIEADIDTTAMAITALAEYLDMPEVKAAIDKAIEYLSGVQSDSGGYASYGSENSNSASMAVIALAALNIDAKNDARFVKSGGSLIEALLSFQTKEGTLGYDQPDYNAYATEQGFRALVAYTNWQKAGKAYNVYVFVTDMAKPPTKVDKTALESAIHSAGALKQSEYTAPTWAALASALKSAKEIYADPAATQVLVYNAAEGLRQAIQNLRRISAGPSISISFELIGDTNRGAASGANPHAWINRAYVSVNGNATVYDVFTKMIYDNGMDFVEKQRGYISAIQAPGSYGAYWLHEFDNGPYSGWVYTVNGAQLSRSCRDYVLKDGDAVVWRYVNDYRSEYSPGSSGSGGYGGSSSPGGDYNGPSSTSSDIFEYAAQEGKDENAPQAGTQATLAPAGFSDVPAGYWAKQFIDYLSARGILLGAGNGRFEPDRNITRAEFVTILFQWSGDKAPGGSTKFADVPSSEWFAPNVAWALENGITAGVSEMWFAPGAYISRQDSAVMVKRYMDLKKIALKEIFNDGGFSDNGKIAGYAKTTVESMRRMGVVAGMGGNAFAPTENCTRAQAAVMIAKILMGMDNK